MAVSRAKFSDDEVRAAMRRFVQISDDLRAKAYSRLARSERWPTLGVVVDRFCTETFEEAVWRVAVDHGRPDASYRWSTCPNGYKHSAAPAIYSTVEARLTGRCADCVVRAERLEAQPSFREKHPYAVPWLADPADAETKQKLVMFRCSRCNSNGIPWSPDPDDAPLCHYCRTVGDAAPGDLIPRRGGGAHVQLEHDVATALQRVHALDAVTDMGIVIPQGAIMIDGTWGPYPLPAVKPDIVLPTLSIAVEVDTGGRHALHAQPRDVQQDQQRDKALNAVNWRVLRVREPGWPTIGEWSWRVESKSQAPIKLAGLIMQTIAISRHQ